MNASRSTGLAPVVSLALGTLVAVGLAVWAVIVHDAAPLVLLPAVAMGAATLVCARTQSRPIAVAAPAVAAVLVLAFVFIGMASIGGLWVPVLVAALAAVALAAEGGRRSHPARAARG